MLKVGVTGNIGSGKSTVCSIFESLGIPVWYADQEARKLMTYDAQLRSCIAELLGNEAYKGETLNKDFIARSIFSKPELRKELDQLVHPSVQKAVNRWFNSLPPKTEYAIEEAALLIESGGYHQLDILIVVTAPIDLRIHRILRRDNRPIDLVIQQVKSQMPEKDKMALADYIIVNDGSQLLIPQVMGIHLDLQRHQTSKPTQKP